MLKPLLRVLPSYSGNVKLFCTIGKDDYTLIDNNKEYKEFEANVRIAKLQPLSSNLAQNNIEISLLNSNYEFDIQKFYNRYSDYFFSNCFEYDKSDYELIDKTEIQKPRNIDFEFGCKRVSYMKSGKQFAFFAPVWMESGEDIPDYFRLCIRIKNNLYDVKRYIRINIKNNSKSPYNYLDKYVTRYANKLDDNCIFCMPQSKQATYYGIDLLKGGFNRHVDNIIGKIFSKQSTINNFDAVISGGWKRTFLCMKQVLPLCFCFSLNDIFNEEEYKRYINTQIYISGEYYKDNVQLPFYDFDVNYTEVYEKPYVLNNETGNMHFNYTGINLMNTKYPSLNEGKYIGYRYSNKLSPMYSRWKLKYSTDDDPYITNINPVFSYNQGSKYKYKMYPLQYVPGNMFCTARNSLMLPLSNALKNKRNPYYKDKNIVERYYKIINNHAGTWFDMIYTDEDPMSTDGWIKTHDNKAYYKGVLYNFNNIYNENPDIQHIDKFKVFVKINFLKIAKENLKDIKSAEYTFYVNDNNISKQNITLSSSVLTNTYAPMSVISLYANENKEVGHKHEVDYNSLFMSNPNGTGKFINPLQYGFDFTSYNRYYSLTYLSYLTKDKSDKRFMKGNVFYNDKYTSFITTGYEMLPIYRLNEIYDLNNRILFANENQNHGENILNNLYFSMQGNYVKTKYEVSALKSLKYDYEYDFLQVPLYIKSDFISYGKLKEIIYDVLGTPFNGSTNIYGTTPENWLNEHIDNLPYYNFIPHVRYNNMDYARNVFVRGDKFNEKFYGDLPITLEQLKEDKHFIYVDPYNLSYIMSDVYSSKKAFVQSFKEVTGRDEHNNPIATTEHRSAYMVHVSDMDNLPSTYYIVSGTVATKANEYTKASDIYWVESNEGNNTLFEYNQYNSYEYYAKFLNKDNLKVYLNTTYNNENKSLGIKNGFTSLYIKKRMMINNPQTGELVFKDNYIPLSKFYSKFRPLTKQEQEYIIRNDILTYFENNVNLSSDPAYITYVRVGDIYGNNAYIPQKYDTYTFYYLEEDVNSSNYHTYIQFEDDQKIAALYNTYTYNQFIKDTDGTYIPCNFNDIIYYIENKPEDEKDYYISVSKLLMETIEYNSIYSYWNFTPEYCKQTDIDKIAGIPDQDNYKTSHFNFELYYKKKFLKLDQNLYDIMNLDGIEEVTPEYTDLYLYTLNDKSDISSHVKYYYTEDLTYIDNSLSVDQSLNPLFNNVWQQRKNNTVIYKEWMQKRIYGTPCGDNTYYRFNMDNTKYMLDISGFDYIVEQNTGNNEVYYTYTGVVKEYNNYLDTLDIEADPTDFETFMSQYNMLPYTYDKLNNCYSYLTYIDGCNYLSTYNDYKINTVKQNGEVYGFFVIDTFFDNTYSSFNIINDRYGKQKYFTYINDEDIYAEDFNIKNLFNLILPASKVNLYNNFMQNNVILQKPIPFNFQEIYKSHELKDSYNNTYAYDIKEYGTLHNDILCERYLDSIVPYIKQTGSISSVYNKKFKNMKASAKISYTNDMIMCMNINPYQYEPLHVFDKRNRESLFTPVEYKHFNDNKFINLEEEIIISVGKNITYDEVLELEETDKVLQKFTEYFNDLKKNTYNENEILFLFKKYKVEFDSVPTGLDKERKYKVYSLSYKFKLL